MQIEQHRLRKKVEVVRMGVGNQVVEVKTEKVVQPPKAQLILGELEDKA